ncbi:MAG: hypothetical protein M3R31_07185 [Pseudomonadota bacterium]|nr:hypothetical protein [Pseudomonadota bacterium]
MSRDWLLYLDDLIESAEKIERFLKERSLDYFSVEPQIVWEAATRHVPRILGHARLLRERFEKQAGS